MNATAITVSAITTNRFTAKPYAWSNAAKADTHPDRKRGWGVWAIDCAIAARVPGCPDEVPCQNPVPGRACTPAITARKTPSPARVSWPSLGESQARAGSAISAPATT